MDIFWPTHYYSPYEYHEDVCSAVQTLYSKFTITDVHSIIVSSLFWQLRYPSECARLPRGGHTFEKGIFFF